MERFSVPLKHRYFIVKFKGTCSLNCRIRFRWLKQKYVSYPFEWGACYKLLIAGSQAAGSGNRPAVIKPIAGISLRQQFKQIVSDMPISIISQ
jgi:hypothetical protein